MDLAQVIADAREEVSVLRRTGHGQQAEYVEKLLDSVYAAAEDYITWLPEPAAVLKSGLSVKTLHRRWRELLETDNARFNSKGEREYRSSAIPNRPDVAAARAAGRAIAAGELKRAS
ncbi:MAG: hypothetical protein WEA80_02020 [Gemmatimonadaceae bacterium]